MKEKNHKPLFFSWLLSFCRHPGLYSFRLIFIFFVGVALSACDGLFDKSSSSPPPTTTQTSPAPPQKELPAPENCNWGFLPPKYFNCNGKKYCFGTSVCTSGIYKNIFCEESFCAQGGAICKEDHSPETQACFHKLELYKLMDVRRL